MDDKWDEERMNRQLQAQEIRNERALINAATAELSREYEEHIAELEAENLRLRAELEGTREQVMAVDQRRADVGNEMLDWRRKAELAQAECDAWRIKFTAIMKALGATFYDDTGAEMEP